MQIATSIPIQWRFLMRFGVFSAVLLLAFSRWEAMLSSDYIYLVSSMAAHLLRGLGILNGFDATSLDQGFCALSLENYLFLVTVECTGYFTLLVYLGGVTLYPAPLVRKAWGWSVGSLIFCAYSVLRIVALGLIAQWAPAWLLSSHSYLMVVSNLGFVCFLWSAWIHYRPSERKE